MTRPDSDDNYFGKAKLLDDIVMTLGGRVAEELIIKDISAGASPCIFKFLSADFRLAAVSDSKAFVAAFNACRGSYYLKR